MAGAEQGELLVHFVEAVTVFGGVGLLVAFVIGGAVVLCGLDRKEEPK